MSGIKRSSDVVESSDCTTQTTKKHKSTGENQTQSQSQPPEPLVRDEVNPPCSSVELNGRPRPKSSSYVIVEHWHEDPVRHIRKEVEYIFVHTNIPSLSFLVESDLVGGPNETDALLDIFDCLAEHGLSLVTTATKPRRTEYIFRLQK